MVSDITNPFYGEIIKGAAEAVRQAGYALLLSDTSETGPVERDVVERTLDLVEGVVLASSRMSDSAIRMIAKQKPLVLLNRQIPETSCIVTDNPRGMRRAVEHLGELGHDTITYVAGPEASWADGMRWRALREAATSWSCGCAASTRATTPACAPASPRRGGSSRRRDRRARLQRRAGDRRHQGPQQLGVAVPGDVSVVGFDNVLLAEVVEPELTTVAAPLRKAGAPASATSWPWPRGRRRAASRWCCR